MVRFERSLGLVAVAMGLSGVAAGCGSDGGPADSYASITDELSKPTGMVSETTVTKVGEKFETASSNTFMGVRDDNQTADSSVSGSQACAAGGTVSGTGSGSQSSGHASLQFDKCCFVESCCATGNGDMFYSTDKNAAYSYCASFDMDYSCRGSSAAVKYAACYNLGKAVLLIDVDGASYVVSGTRSGGTGTLEVRGANGTWNCSFASGSGSCSSTTGGSFSFSAAAG